PRRIVVSNTAFLGSTAIQMEWNATAQANTSQLDQLLVYGYQDNSADNFQVYYSEQGTQSVAGGRAPCTSTRPAIGGIVCPISGAGTPTITSVSPTTGNDGGGASVTINGSNFATGARVSFGGPSATQVVVNSPTRITAISPAHEPGTVDLTVYNADGRSATLGNAYTFTNASPCIYNISPTASTVGSADGSGTVTVTSSAGCAWTASSGAGWLTITSGSGNGNGTVSYSVAANSGGTRTRTLWVAGVPYTVVQAALEAATADFDGDRLAEIGVYRPSTGHWFLRQSSSGYNSAAALDLQWGLSGDIPVPGDFDGDRRMDVAVYRRTTGEWFIRYSTQGYSVAATGYYQWGLPGDTPIVGDFDGDGQADVTVYRPSTGQWFIRYSTQGYNASTYGLFQWGLADDVPVPADFDGDGKTDLAVYRPSTGEWFIVYSLLGYNAGASDRYQWGLVGDMPIAGDFDRDGKADLTVYRPSTGEWFIRYSLQGYSPSSAG